MASSAEQLAANMQFSAFAKAKDLQKRILFTIIVIAIYRFGAFVPLPGVDPDVWRNVTGNLDGTLFSTFNMFTGQAFERMTIFALGIFPYITASIVMQLLATVIPSLETLKKEGEQGRRKINQYTRYLTILITMFQGSLAATYVLSQNANSTSGLIFYLSIVSTLVGGTLFLLWLGEQITARGVGNGISLLIYAGIVAGVPSAVSSLFKEAATGRINTLELFAVLAIVIVSIMFVVFVERAQRRVLINYPRQQGQHGFINQQSSHIPLKLNPAGVIPPIFASAILSFPLTIQMFSQGTMPSWLSAILTFTANPENAGYYIITAILITFFTFFYTTITFNPEETADNLRRNGGFIPGIRPGRATADYFDYVLGRLAGFASLYLIIIVFLPLLLRSGFSISAYLGGTSILIMVSVTLDTVTQVQSHLVSHQYESMMKRSKIGKKGSGKSARRGRRR